MSRKNPGPVYPNLKPWELEPHYARHISAMTSEGLHSKAAIAEQLAWRDQRIEALEAALHPTAEEVIRLVAKACGESGDMYIEAAEAWILEKLIPKTKDPL